MEDNKKKALNEEELDKVAGGGDYGSWYKCRYCGKEYTNWSEYMKCMDNCQLAQLGPQQYEYLCKPIIF